MSYERTDTPNTDGSTTVRIIASDDLSWTPYYPEATKVKPTWPEAVSAGPDYPLYTALPSNPGGPLAGYIIDGVRYQKSLFVEHQYRGDFSGFCPLGLTPRFILPTMGA